MGLREYAAAQQAQGIQEPQQPQQAINSLSRSQAQQEAAAQQAAGVYQIYQRNIKLTYQLEADILKGLKAGADLGGLFLKALKALSYTTDNELLYRQGAEDLKNNYGIKE